MAKRHDKRTTVSLATVIWDMAVLRMEDKGFNDNFSAYVADLIRRDQERAEGKSALSVLPGESGSINRLNETAPAVSYKKKLKP